MRQGREPLRTFGDLAQFLAKSAEAVEEPQAPQPSDPPPAEPSAE